jgi:hypothetical protein
MPQCSSANEDGQVCSTAFPEQSEFDSPFANPAPPARSALTLPYLRLAPTERAWERLANDSARNAPSAVRDAQVDAARCGSTWKRPQ